MHFIVMWLHNKVCFVWCNTPNLSSLSFCFCFCSQHIQVLNYSSWLMEAQVRGKCIALDCWWFKSFIQSSSDKKMISNKTFPNPIVLSLSSTQSPLSAFDPTPLKFPVIQWSQSGRFCSAFVIANQLVELQETHKNYLKRLF